MSHFLSVEYANEIIPVSTVVFIVQDLVLWQDYYDAIC